MDWSDFYGLGSVARRQSAQMAANTHLGFRKSAATTESKWRTLCGNAELQIKLLEILRWAAGAIYKTC